MKFVYTQKYEKILNENPFLPPIDVLVFSGFVSEDGSIPELTDPRIIIRNKDWIQANNDYLASFFGSSPLANSGYIGKWSNDINANAKIYYIIDDKDIREFIVSKYNEISFSNDLNGLDYFVNINGNIMRALLEPGDIIFDNYEEAKNQINN